MIVLLRLVLAVLLTLPRLLRSLGRAEIRSGRTFFVKVHKHKGKILRFELATPTRLAARFSFDREGKLDRWLRTVGLVTELQTHDSAFDDKVFIACDDEGVHTRLKSSIELRTAISRVLNHVGNRVVSDGKHIRLSVATNELPSAEDFTRLQHIVTLIEAARGSGRRIDPFFARVIAVEVVFGLLLAYGIGGVAALAARTVRSDLYLATSDFLCLSLMMGAGLVVCGLGFLAVVVRGSSRAWRVASDGLLLLIFAVPTAAIALAVDLNEHFDEPPVVVPVRIEQIRSERHSTKSGVHYTWHASLTAVDASSAPVLIPDEAEITERTKNTLQEGTVVDAVIGRGALGAPYWISLGR